MFWLELSYRYHTPVRLLQQNISWGEFKELQAYERIRPHQDTQLRLYLAQLAMLIAESNRDADKRKSPFELKEFIMRFRKRRAKKQTEDDMIAICKMMADLWPYRGSVNGDNR